MRTTKLLPLAVLLLSGVIGHAQQNKAEVKEHEPKVRDMVAFLEYVLNTIGNANTSARDKDVLIRESYTKIFRDAKVQVEDDLVEKRNVITNKDVQAYLKDVDFFFRDVKFEFTVKEIKGSVNANDKLFYKVSLLRNINGTTSDGMVINNTIPRYIEINYDPQDQDLKIVSIYTNEFDEKVALTNWWKGLSYEWQSIFKRKLNIVTDSVKLGDIQNIMSLDVLDLSQNKYIQSIDPLGQLVNLQVLDLSWTSVLDLSPIRNLTELRTLSIEGTDVSDITALKYADKLTRLNINNTNVPDISVIAERNSLESLEMKSTPVEDFGPVAGLTSLKSISLERTQITDLSPLSSLTRLEDVNLSATGVSNLEPIQVLKELAVLNLDSTRISELMALRGLEKLRVLYINYCMVSNLRPLLELQHLERIYCDHTPIKRTLADAFMASNSKVLVIFDSEDLSSWWGTLSDAWKEVLTKTANVQLNPSKEELAKVTNIDSIDIAGNSLISSLRPLQNLQKLQVLVAGNTSISDLSPLQDHREIRTLDISDTKVDNFSVVSQFERLTEIRADNTGIQSLDVLNNLGTLEKVFVDGTAIADGQVRDFLQRRKNCLVIFKTDELESWWNELSVGWKDIYSTQVPIRAATQREDLHRLVELEALHFQDVPISNLSSLHAFVRLSRLDFSGTGVADLSPLASIETLVSLHATNSPIADLSPLRLLGILEDLDISNTPVEDLGPLISLHRLKSLNCSGTQIKRIDELEYLQELESLDCSNTNVKKISALSGLPLKVLKCYNTRVSGKTIEKFRLDNPDCNVVFY
jgi:Leucine-rich repeat (LRR) protein